MYTRTIYLSTCHTVCKHTYEIYCGSNTIHQVGDIWNLCTVVLEYSCVYVYTTRWSEWKGRGERKYKNTFNGSLKNQQGASIFSRSRVVHKLTSYLRVQKVTFYTHLLSINSFFIKIDRINTFVRVFWNTYDKHSRSVYNSSVIRSYSDNFSQGTTHFSSKNQQPAFEASILVIIRELSVL